MLQIGLNKVKFGVFKEMYKISKKTEYSLIILKHIDSKCVTELTTAREIEQNYKAPFDTCAKVMQQMGTKGIVKSIQGVKGGYQLAKPTSEITFFELVEAVEGKKTSDQMHERSL
jgi:Rrf2 family protein